MLNSVLHIMVANCSEAPEFRARCRRLPHPAQTKRGFGRGCCRGASVPPCLLLQLARAGCRGVGNYGALQATSNNTRDRGRANSPAVATQRTTEREPRRALALSVTPPEMLTAAVAVDGLQSAARRSAAKGSDDMAAMGDYWA
jgi:hypothetical protein